MECNNIRISSVHVHEATVFIGRDLSSPGLGVQSQAQILAVIVLHVLAQDRHNFTLCISA